MSSMNSRKRKHNSASAKSNGNRNRVSNASIIFNVEAIVDRRLSKNMSSIEYKVRWDGYDESEDSWEPQDNLIADDLIDVIQEFEKKRLDAIYCRREKFAAPIPATMITTSVCNQDPKYIGKTVLRMLEHDGLCIGTVTKHIQKKKTSPSRWHVDYKNGKSEDLEEVDLVAGILVAEAALGEAKLKHQTKGRR